MTPLFQQEESLVQKLVQGLPLNKQDKKNRMKQCNDLFNFITIKERE